MVWIHSVDQTDPAARLLRISRLNGLDYAQARDVFSHLAIYRTVPFTFSVAGQPPQRAFGQIVSPSYFELLGLEAEVGRVFWVRDSEAETSNTVVLSHSLWRRSFDSDPTVVGRTIQLNGHPFVVMGVSGHGFKGPKTLGYADLWVALASHEQVLTGPSAKWFDQRGSLVFEALGRMQPGVSLEQTREVLGRLATTLRERYPDANKDLGATVIPYLDGAINPNYRRTLRFGLQLMLGVVLLLLLIASANVGSLLLDRALARRQEIATRLALGAGRRQLLAQLLTESAVLVAPSLALALAVFGGLRSWLWTLRPPFVADAVELTPDWRVLAFSLGLSLGTTLLCGLAPALALLRGDQLASVANPRAEGGSPSGLVGRLRGAIIAGQLAVCLVALVGSGLFLRSLGELRAIDPGFRHRDVVYAGLEIGTAGYDRARGLRFQQSILEAARGLPAVLAAGLSELTLPAENQATFSVEPVDEAARPELSNLHVPTNSVAPGYFEVVGLPLVEGRDFGPEDTAEVPARVILNRRLAELLWPGASPLGRRFSLDGEPVSVVGVVANAKYNSLTEEPQPFSYRPLAQRYTPSFHLALRSSAPTAALLGSVRSAVAGLDPNLPVLEVHTTSELLDTTMWSARVGASLLSVVAALAFVLAAIGVYSTHAAAIQSRRREVALRLALGGAGSSVLGNVLRRSATPVAIGLALGSLVAVFLARRAAPFLVGDSALQPAIFALAALSLAAVAILAAALTAGRILRSPPITALKGD